MSDAGAGIGCPCFKTSSLIMLMKVNTTSMRTERIVIMSPCPNLSAGVHLSKKRSTASLHLQPKSVRLPVRLPLSRWIPADRNRPSLRTARMGMVLRSMTTTATPGFPFRPNCQSHPATLSQPSHRTSFTGPQPLTRFAILRASLAVF